MCIGGDWIVMYYVIFVYFLVNFLIFVGSGCLKFLLMFRIL